MTRPTRWIALGATLLFAACSNDAGDLLSPTMPDLPGPVADPLAPVCQDVTFEGFEHGGDINTIPVTLAGGFNLTVSTLAGPADPGEPDVGADQAKAYDTSDPVGPDPDLEAGADCPDCAGLGKVMVIANADFAAEGDYRFGGTITMTGFPAGVDVSVESFTVVDHESPENSITLSVDGTEVGQSVAIGDGSVQTVNAAENTVQSNLVFTYGGSGAVDNIRLCTTPEPPPENPGTGTPGYWRNHPDAWPVSSITVGGVAYTVEEAIEVIQRPGRGDKSYDLFDQLVAAKLNVLIGNESSCVDAVIAGADAWFVANPLGSRVRARSDAWQDEGSAYHGTLDAYNNGELCAPSRDD